MPINQNCEKHSVNESALVGGFVDGFALVGDLLMDLCLLDVVDKFAIYGVLSMNLHL